MNVDNVGKGKLETYCRHHNEDNLYDLDFPFGQKTPDYPDKFSHGDSANYGSPERKAIEWKHGED